MGAQGSWLGGKDSSLGIDIEIPRMKVFIRNNYKVLLFVSFIWIIFLREPSLFIEPRFWAEEGSVYISYAYTHSWYENLLAPHLGYYSLFNNLIASIATKVVPLTYAPFVTTFGAFIVQIISFLIILWGDSICWNNIYKRIIVSLSILFVSSTGEIWLT